MSELSSIILCSQGGLGNRLRPILSAISMLEQINDKYDLKCLWIKDRGLDIHFNELFDINLIKLTTVKDICVIKPYIDDCMFNDPEPNYRPHNVELSKKENHSGSYNKNIDYLINNNKSFVYPLPFFIDSSFVNPQKYPSIFNMILNKNIKSEILKIATNLNITTDVIGCHIRASDYIDIDPNIIKRIYNIKTKIKNNKMKRYFICSDESRFEKLFNNIDNVVIYKKKYDIKKEDENKGCYSKNCYRGTGYVLESVVDLCLLSMCNTENDSYHSLPGSTFLDSARKIKGWDKI